MKVNQIYQGDCLELMRQIDDGSIDMVLCDLPYGVTQHKEDIQIDLVELWIHYKRILKEKGLVILTCQFPFTLDIINSNKEGFKYDIIWDKVMTTGFLNANRMPLRQHEHLLVFYQKQPVYNPQKTSGDSNHSIGKATEHKQHNYGSCGRVDNRIKLGSLKHPTSLLRIPKLHSSITKHRTEKPVELAEWLIKTYSNEGDLILDNCIGCGWTAVACQKNNRRFIGMELRQDFVDITNKRLKQEGLI